MMGRRKVVRDRLKREGVGVEELKERGGREMSHQVSREFKDKREEEEKKGNSKLFSKDN